MPTGGIHWLQNFMTPTCRMMSMDPWGRPKHPLCLHDCVALFHLFSWRPVLTELGPKRAASKPGQKEERLYSRRACMHGVYYVYRSYPRVYARPGGFWFLHVPLVPWRCAQRSVSELCFFAS